MLQVQLPVTLVTRHSTARHDPQQIEREDLHSSSGAWR